MVFAFDCYNSCIMDYQTILIAILLILSLNLVLVGVYIVLVLRDVRKLINNTHEFVSFAKGSFTNITTLSAALPLFIKTAAKVYKNVSQKNDGKKE